MSATNDIVVFMQGGSDFRSQPVDVRITFAPCSYKKHYTGTLGGISDCEIYPVKIVPSTYKRAQIDRVARRATFDNL